MITPKMLYDQKYATVAASLPHWKPSREDKVFGVVSIKQVVTCTFLDALKIKRQLEAEGIKSQKRWNESSTINKHGIPIR